MAAQTPLDSLPDPVLALSPQGEIRQAWGPVEVLGEDRELRGRSFASLFASPRAARELVAAGAVAKAVRELALRDRRRFSVTAAPLPAGAGVAVSLRSSPGRRDEMLGLIRRTGSCSAPAIRAPSCLAARASGGTG